MEVREFLTRCRSDGVFTPSLDGWMSGVSKSFSRLLAARGWVGMTIPKHYGGAGRSYLERFVVAEELLAAGAPVAAHWANERQFAPQLLRIGTEEQRRRFLPAIARAEVMFSIGLSEPDSGTDLASVRTRAVRRKVGGGSTGRRSGAPTRTEPITWWCCVEPATPRIVTTVSAKLLVPLGADGVEVRPIVDMTGEADFCEVFFSDVDIPESDVIGEVGEGWRQALAELDYERSGPDRYMSTFPLIERFAATADLSDRQVAATLGQLIAEIVALRSLSIGVVQASEAGIGFGVDAALAKDVGTTFEQDSLELIREAGPHVDGELRRYLDAARLASPAYTLRGGTNEILRSITARKLLGW